MIFFPHFHFLSNTVAASAILHLEAGDLLADVCLLKGMWSWLGSYFTLYSFIFRQMFASCKGCVPDLRLLLNFVWFMKIWPIMLRRWCTALSVGEKSPASGCTVWYLPLECDNKHLFIVFHVDGYISNTCVDIDYEAVKRKVLQLKKIETSPLPPPPPDPPQLLHLDCDNRDRYIRLISSSTMFFFLLNWEKTLLTLFN